MIAVIVIAVITMADGYGAVFFVCFSLIHGALLLDLLGYVTKIVAEAVERKLRVSFGVIVIPYY